MTRRSLPRTPSLALTLTLTLTLALTLLAPATAQDRVGQLTAVSGDVFIKRQATGQEDQARQVGPRVRNGSLFGGDELRTEAGASATLVFSDSSRIVLEPSTRIAVREADLSAVLDTAEVTKPLGRTIKIIAGDVLADIVPNPDIATAFETPTGVAAVKGTSFRLGVDEHGLETLSTSEGEVRFQQRGSGLALRVGAGNAVSMTKNEDAGVSVSFPDSNSGDVDIELASGETIEAIAGTDVSSRSQGYAARLTVSRGAVSRSDGSSVASGQAMGFANSDFQLPPGAPVKVATDRGSVDFLNTTSGLRAEVEAGFGITVAGGGDSRLKVVLPSSNPGAMPIKVGKRSMKANPQTNMAVDNGRSSLSVDVDQGEITVTNEDGTDTTVGAGDSLNVGGEPADEEGEPAAQPVTEEEEEEGEEDEEESQEEDDEDEFTQLNCGECGVQVGDACQDDDALCEQDCYADRRCQAGRCTGGRRLTSFEDPNCS